MCVCVYVYLYTYTCICIFISVYLYKYVYVCIFINVYFMCIFHMYIFFIFFLPEDVSKIFRIDFLAIFPLNILLRSYVLNLPRRPGFPLQQLFMMILMLPFRKEFLTEDHPYQNIIHLQIGLEIALFLKS